MLVNGVGVPDALPKKLEPLLIALHKRCQHIANNTNPDAIHRAIRRELRMFRELLAVEYGHVVSWVKCTLDGERIEVP